MNKREFRELEKTFAAEIDGGVYQGINKTIKKLELEGYVQKITKRLGMDQFGLIKVEGYVTTFKGNIHYCTNCK